MMRQNIFENRKRQTPKMTFVFVLSGLHWCKPLFSLNILLLFEYRLPSLKVAFWLHLWYNIAQEVWNEKK